MFVFRSVFRCKLLLLVSVLTAWSQLAGARDVFQIEVDYAAEGVEQPAFWQSTGMSPAEMLLTNDMRLTLEMMGAAYNNAFRYMRPHYLLDLVSVESEGEGDNIRYDFSRLDQALDPIINNGIQLFFELMGNPSGRFGDFREKSQVMAWRDFVETLATHLIKRYGESTVEQWYFETTNEPDIHPFWPQSYAGFLNYFDASSEGLKAADPDLRFGGPANGRLVSPALKVLLQHVESGTNVITGKKGGRLDFISFHVKALPHQMVRFEQHAIDYIREYHPTLADVPIVNNEADPIGGWGIPYWWRGGPWHGAFVAQSIDLHNRIILDKVGANLLLAAGDNGFQGTWDKRTLLARFLVGDNEVEQWGASDPGGWKPWDQTIDPRPKTERFYLVKKPGMTAMSLAALLGDTRYPVTGFPPLIEVIDNYRSEAPHLGCVATAVDNGNHVLLCYNAPAMNLGAVTDGDGRRPTKSQQALVDKSDARLELNIQGLKSGSWRVSQFHIDDNNGNAQQLWRKLGSPEDLDTTKFMDLQKVQDPALVLSKTRRAGSGSLELKLDLDAPSLSAIVLTPESARQKLAAVSDFKESRYTGGAGERMSFLRWSSDQSNNQVVMYDVFYAAPGSDKFMQLSGTGLLDQGFTIAGVEAGGRARVVARNVFGDESKPVEYQFTR